jgi:hypothetical protein
MPISSLPVLASAAALAIGIFGLGAHYLYGRNSATVAVVEPLFARSVEQAELLASRWPPERLDVPFYGPMVELLTLGASLSHKSTTDHQQRQLAAERQTGRATTTGGDQPRRQVRQSRRANGERKDDGRLTEVNPRDAYARGESVPRGSSRPEDNSRDGRRSDRGVNRVPPGAERDEQRSREPESRASVRQEDRDRRVAPASEGVTPFRMFGIFDSR